MFSQSNVVNHMKKVRWLYYKMRHLQWIWLKYMDNALPKKGERPGGIDSIARDKAANAGDFQFLNEGHKVRIHP